ncbi:integrase catalytic domain-containing protein [Bradyrhizobium sp. USDA 10063]
MIPTLLPSLERHGRLKLDQTDRALVLGVSAATIDRLLVETKTAATGGKRRRVGFYSAVRREVPIRTFNDWHDPPPGFCEVDMVAHGGTSVAGSFIQTLTMVDVATGWTECMPLVTRERGLVVRAMERSQNLFPWLIRGADFDNDSAFMNDVVVPWCGTQKIEVTRSRAYKKNDQAFVEQKNGAVVRRLVGYGRFDGVETTRVLERLYAASRLHTNFFQPSFKLKVQRREGAKVIKRYHVPATPDERALAHARLSKVVKRRLRELYRMLDPVAFWPRCETPRRSSARASTPDRAGSRRQPAHRPRQRTQQRSRRGSVMTCI